MAVVLLNSAAPSSASPVAPPEYASLTEESASAREQLPKVDQLWFAELEASEGAGSEGGEVTAFGVVKTTTGDRVVAAALGETTICARFSSYEAFECSTPERIAQGLAMVVKPGCHRNVVMGFVPNGVNALSVEAEGQESGETIAVANNVFEAELGAEDVTLSAQGPRPFAMSVPLGRTPSNCVLPVPVPGQASTAE